MQWSDELILIREVGLIKTDEAGFTLPRDEEATTVYANRKSVGFKEFFEAKRTGYTEHAKFDIHTFEYTGQTLAECEGKRYKILRAYTDPKTSGEYTELTLSDLSEGGEANEL